jgi:hypothetical protein
VSLGPHDETPMIPHEQVRADPHGPGDERFLDDALERLEVGILQEQAHAADATIEHVEEHSTRTDAGRARHTNGLAITAGRANN